MSSPAADSKQALLDAVLRLAGHRLAGAAAKEARGFLALYYDQVDADDMGEREPEDLYGAGMAHLAFARRFASGKPKLRVYNPRVEEHGWTSAHTVIEIVNDDMPFLVDSVTMEVNRQGYALQLLLHPLARSTRDADGNLLAFSPAGRDGGRESLMHVEVDRESDPARLKALADGVLSVLADVRAAVADWQPMRAAMAAIVAEIARPPRGLDAAEVAEVRAFLSWLLEENFTFIGYREYDLDAVDGEDQLSIVAESGLGVLREPRARAVSTSFRELPASIRALAREPSLLVLTKANSRATVHRPGYLDYIGVKRFDAAGRVTGERRFVGLYTTAAYHADPRDIPLLRRKVARVLDRAAFPEASHGYKNLLALLRAYPRDELIQVDESTLAEIALGVLRLGDRRRTRLFLRRDLYGRFFSCVIYLPRENFNTDVRVRIQEILKRRLSGTSVEYTVHLSDAVLARVHMLVRTAPRDELQPDEHAIEAEIVQATRRWEDDLALALTDALGEEQAVAMSRRYARAFPAGYRETLSPRAAVRDIAVAETLSETNPFAVSLYRPVEADSRSLRLRVYRLGARLPLSAALPILDNMGLEALEEDGWEIERADATAVFLHDFGLRGAFEVADIETIKPITEEALLRLGRGEIENDAFNRLTPGAALAPDDVVVLRAYAKYLRQTGFSFSLAYVAQTLAAHAAIVAKLIAIFHARFDPAAGGDREAEQQRLHDEVKAALNSVAILDEDRILRRFLYVIRATVRTNHWVRDARGCRKAYLSLKFESAKVPELPEPCPLFEIFVYSPRFEAIHLRGGKVARGGIRWSDRPEDFRTEVLGLMKAQMVKNAVIVPVGSKGGFVLKTAPPPAEREAYLREGIACYQEFLRGLLDLTDNLSSAGVVPPRNVVRHDADDTYLVVAADKGTAAFSDHANEVSAEYGHWLGDAFASGGSVGYDHKKMGITARGTWESVKRHFREMGVDTQSQDFTVAGIGDMSGDVFGNAMLLSPHIALVAAFDHRHIFIDPQPDPERSFRERKRLFAMPRSSWDDYDRALLSRGGGVYPRSAKSIALSAEARRCLSIADAELAPGELVKAILKAPVDLLFNGGIGTYVKATGQTNNDVGDRANDGVRVNAAQLRCRVVGEGGNLGFTQLGRVEFALRGGRIYTDAIDNSAGVDCSDHEVNIKILLGLVMAEGELTARQRATLLAGMTDEVARLVLADNYHQTQSLSISGVRSEKILDAQASFMRSLEKAGRLSRGVEFLPGEDEIAERRALRVGLASPERSVLLAYSKMVLFDALVKGRLIDDEYVAQALLGYFPAELTKRYAAVMPRHPLKREIIATVVANAMINRTGAVFVHRMQEETGASAEEVTRAFILVRDIYGLESAWAAIEALDNRVTWETQAALLVEAGRLVTRATLWFLRRRREVLPIAEVLGIFQPGLAVFRGELFAIQSVAERELLEKTAAAFVAKGVPPELARELASLDAFYALLDTTEVARETGRPLATVARLHFALTGELELRWFAERITALPADTPWQAKAKNALRDDLSGQHRIITASIARLSADAQDAEAMIAAWKERCAQPLARLATLREELKLAGPLDLAVLSVLFRELRGLA